MRNLSKRLDKLKSKVDSIQFFKEDNINTKNVFSEIVLVMSEIIKSIDVLERRDRERLK